MSMSQLNAELLISQIRSNILGGGFPNGEVKEYLDVWRLRSASLQLHAASEQTLARRASAFSAKGDPAIGKNKALSGQGFHRNRITL